MFQKILKNGEKLFIKFSGISNDVLFVNFYRDKEAEDNYTDWFEFKDEYFDEDWKSNKLKLERMFCPYPREGIGTFIVERVIELTGKSIYTSHPYDFGIKDGSEITRAGKYFIDALIKKGLIEDYDSDDYDDNYYDEDENC